MDANPGTSSQSEDVATVLEEASAPPAEGARAEVPPRIGRYMTLRRLGEGSMGEVLLGYDEHLDRRVAIKVVRAMGQRASEVYARMLREAQGLARLSHPNVVQVYEAGEFDGRVYLAMEYVEGVTLRAWSKMSLRTWREVLDRCLEAGRGLAAAHAAGLVHRDFKPDNVMLGADGRVRVLDFGLVRTGQEATPSERSLELRLSSSANELSSELTAAHSLIGTPAYMSPEQHLRQVADARSDVFAFCVTLHELLFGVRPFAGKDQGSIMRAVLEQSFTPPLEGRRVPPWVRRAVLRGLTIDPGSRWQTMEALLTELRRDPRAQWRRRLVAGTAALALAGGAGWAVQRERTACEGGEAALAEVWDAARREAVQASLSATGVAYAGEVSARVAARLDEYAAEWAAMRRAACLDHRSGANSGELLDLRMGCLDQRRQELAALVDQLAAADAPLVERASAAVGDLPRVATCGDLEALQARLRPPDDPRVATQVEALRATLAEALALERAGRYGAGLERAEAGAAEAELVEYAPLLVEFQVLRGRLKHRKGESAEAAKILEDVYYEARALGYDAAAISASTWILQALANGQNDFAAADRWLRLARAEVRHAGTREQEADLAFKTGGMKHARGDYAGALADMEAALAGRREVFGAVDPESIEVMTALGVTHFKLGRTAEAERYLEQARRLAEVALGPEHPQMGMVLTRLGMLRSRERRFEAAAPVLERALEIHERSLGPVHPKVAEVLLSLGELEIRRHAYARAVERLERALRLIEALPGPEHPLAAPILGTLAGARYKRGDDLDAVIELLGRAVASTEARLGAEHPNTAIFRSNLGEILNERGRFAEAREKLEASLAALVKAFGPDRIDNGPIHRELARALLGLGEVELAGMHARRALELYGRAPEAQPEEMAKIRFVLARAQVAAGGSSAEGRARALEAREALARLGTERAQVAEIDAWLAGLPPA